MRDSSSVIATVRCLWVKPSHTKPGPSPPADGSMVDSIVGSGMDVGSSGVVGGLGLEAGDDFEDEEDDDGSGRDFRDIIDDFGFGLDFLVSGEDGFDLDLVFDLDLDGLD